MGLRVDIGIRTKLKEENDGFWVGYAIGWTIQANVQKSARPFTSQELHGIERQVRVRAVSPDTGSYARGNHWRRGRSTRLFRLQNVKAGCSARKRPVHEFFALGILVGEVKPHSTVRGGPLKLQAIESGEREFHPDGNAIRDLGRYVCHGHFSRKTTRATKKIPGEKVFGIRAIGGSKSCVERPIKRCFMCEEVDRCYALFV